MERKLFIITLILFLCISFGCDENNAPIEVLFPNGELLPTLQTEIPDEVFAAMKIQADEMSKTVNRYLTPCEENCIIISGAEERREIRELYIEHGLDKVDFHALQKEYYKRYIDAGGIAIVGPDDVEDEYFYYARDTILAMTSKHPGLRDRLLSKHGRFYMVLVRDNRFSLADMPEHQLSPKVLNDDPWDDSLPASCRMSLGDTAAESVPGFCWAGVRRSGAFIRHPYPMWTFAHEFAHAIDLEIRLQVMPDLEERVKEFARNRGIDYVWYEIFASGVEQWFHNIGPNQVNPTYEVFFEKHPGLGEILDELFPRVSLSVEPIFPPDPALMND